MEVHYLIMAAAADACGWRFFTGIDEARNPTWGESNKAVHFPTFKQAHHVARRFGNAEICASFTTNREAKR